MEQVPQGDDVWFQADGQELHVLVWWYTDICENNLQIVVFCQHIKPNNLYWSSANLAFWIDVWPMCNAARAELVATKPCISNIIASTVQMGQVHWVCMAMFVLCSGLEITEDCSPFLVPVPPKSFVCCEMERGHNQLLCHGGKKEVPRSLK